MSKLKLIIEREYTSRVKKKSFLLLTILVPIVFLSFLFGAMYLGQEETKQLKVLVADPGNWCENYIFQKDTVNAPAKFYFYNDYVDSAKTFLESKKYESYDVLVSLNEKIPENRRVVAFYKTKPSLKSETYIRNRIETRIRKYFAIKKTKLTKMEYDLIQLPFDFIFIDAKNPSGKDQTRIKAVIGFIGSILIFMFIFLYANQVMRGVIEEKTNRVVEIIISSVKPFQLMMGKIIGIGLVGLTQFIIWVAISGVGLFIIRLIAFPDLNNPNNWDPTQMDHNEIISTGLNGSSEIISLIYNDINWLTLLIFFIIYFLGGFLIYSGLFAMIGAMVDSESDTQQILLPVIMPLFLGYVVSVMMIGNPESTIASWFSIIPFTSPIVMMVKVAIGSVSPWLYIPSILLLIVTFFITTWMASKIYRTGILMYGKKASWKEVFKWLKYK